jgi:hypothetical protein
MWHPDTARRASSGECIDPREYRKEKPEVKVKIKPCGGMHARSVHWRVWEPMTSLEPEGNGLYMIRFVLKKDFFSSANTTPGPG